MPRACAAGGLVDEALAAFIQGGTSIHIACRDAENRPSLARACACRLSPDHRKIVLILAEAEAEAVLVHLRQTGAIAAVFCQPSSHRAIQIKATDARRVPLAAGDRGLVTAHATALVHDLLRAGYPAAPAQASGVSVPAGLAAVAFTPTAAFDQTPGPGAGRPCP